MAPTFVSDAAFSKVQGTHIPRSSPPIAVYTEAGYVPTIDLNFDICHIKESALYEFVNDDKYTKFTGYNTIESSGAGGAGGASGASVKTAYVQLPNGSYPGQMIRIIFEADDTTAANITNVQLKNESNVQISNGLLGTSPGASPDSAALICIWDMTTWKVLEYETLP